MEVVKLRINWYLLLCVGYFILFQALSVFANLEAQVAMAGYNRQFFIENKGQWPSEVLYLTCFDGLDAWITTKGVVYDFYKLEEVSEPKTKQKRLPNKFVSKKYIRTGHVVQYELQGNNINPIHEGKQKQEGYYNYFLGNDPRKQATFVGLYKEVIVKEIYRGIDIRYYFDKGNLRYDYIVRPSADPTQIAFKIKGSDKTYVDEVGNLVFTTCFGEIRIAKLYCYQTQDKRQVSSKFICNGESFMVEVDSYDNKQDLIIDPLIYSSFLGGSSLDVCNSIAVDIHGNAYISGKTKSTDYPTTLGTYQTMSFGAWDAFVAKLNAIGTELEYSTYIGGNGDDEGYSIVVDVNGEAYVTGFTNSINFPTTTYAYQKIYWGGTSDVFVTKLNSTGTELIYSTYIGGKEDDVGYSIAIDIGGYAYITGWTKSTDYPTTLRAYQKKNKGLSDVFVTKLSFNGNDLIFSTLLGGSYNDEGYSIALDGERNVYVAGQAGSVDFPITPDAYQTTHRGGNSDIFVTKFNTKGTELIYSTFIGGSDWEEAWGITIDDFGNAFLAGWTSSTNFPTTAGAAQTVYGGGFSDAFVLKLNPIGTDLIFSSYIGGDEWDEGWSIVINWNGNAFVSGWTKSTNFPTTSDAYQIAHRGLSDAYLTKIDSLGTSLIHSTFIGGGDWDEGWSIAIDWNENVYIAGYTKSTDFPTTPNAYQATYAGILDGFVTKISFSPTTSVSEDLPSRYFLHQNYPNPFKSETFIEFELGKRNPVRLAVYDVLGREVKVLIDDAELEAGHHRIKFHSENLPNGVFYYRLTIAGKPVEVKTMVLMK